MHTSLAFAALFLSLSADLPTPVRVPEIAVTGLSDIAITSIDASGRTVIYYNPDIMKRSGPALTAFFFAHEYGHVNLDHLRRQFFIQDPYSRAWMNAKLETEADCWAAASLSETNPAAIDAAVVFFQSQIGTPTRPNYPSWAERAATVRRCAVPPQASCQAQCRLDNAECLRRIRPLAACMEERVSACVDTCMNSFGHPYEECVGQLCRPDSPPNQRAWGDRCRAEQEVGLGDCANDLAGCRDACAR
ncbi:MAG: hypothetical protein RL272_506 [Candidatus Parcubacteria bacterium]|jgi:hypothetical protein